MDEYQSWGRLQRQQGRAVVISNAADALDALSDVKQRDASVLPFGNGRSYGDSCHNDGGVLLDCRGLRKLISFDRENGILACEAGMLLADILDIVVPAGWFLSVTPGTKFVTIGGAIANDVHGKNHHLRGTFGRYVRRFELLRSDGSRMICARDENAEFFAATIGGLGLTGLITWAEIELLAIASNMIDQQVTRFHSLEDFWDLAVEADKRFEYSVAWIDSLSRDKALGRGLLITGTHADGAARRPGTAAARSVATRSVSQMEQSPRHAKRALKVPFVPPISLVNRWSLKLFNALYYRKQWPDRKKSRVRFDPFFYPLDGIMDWNRLYGPKGLFQHQCVLPGANGMAAVRELLERTQRAQIGSFLTVLKLFGDKPSPGLLSFPQAGLTLTLDFANAGAKTLSLLDDLDEVVLQAGGRVNPYKDARMSAASYQAFFPQWRELEPFIDPAFSSSFWRRVTVDV